MNDWSGSIKRGIKYAARAAENSDSPTYHIGAAVVKNGRVIGIGWNSYRKTSPNAHTRHKTIHAEFSSIKRLTNKQLSGAYMFIARITNGGSLAIAKPCYACEVLLRSLPLRQIFYTGRSGEILPWRHSRIP